MISSVLVHIFDTEFTNEAINQRIGAIFAGMVPSVDSFVALTVYLDPKSKVKLANILVSNFSLW